MTEALDRPNPFPGLRPFETRDKFLYFGREEQTAAVMARLRERRFLAVVGTSGSGKSSLVRAGLIPGLHGGLLAGAGPNWKIAVMRPGGDPTGNLARALHRLDLMEDATEGESFIRTTLARSAFGLSEFADQAGLPERYNLLVVVDQFEEIFRFRARSRTLEEEAGGFVRLLLEATRQRDGPIYVVLAMRSDFLGDCAEFGGLAEAINQGEYLVPRMRRDQYRLAIEGPVRVGGGRISGRLVQRLLNDMGTNPDQLPVLQHALMRTWDHWVRVSPGDSPMDVEHYEAIGTMSEALSRHADEVYQELQGDRDRALAALVFKSLTESGPDNRGIRRPAKLGALAEITGASLPDLVRVIDPFRRPGRTFLTPALPDPRDLDDVLEDKPRVSRDAGAMDASTVVDISHESLMRVWARLGAWVKEEALSASIYRRLAESARLHAEGRFELLHDPELQLALNWRAASSPNAAWAGRYAEGFQPALDLLEESARSRDKARQAVVRRRRLVFWTVATVACVFFVLWIYATLEHRRASSRWLAMRAEDEVGVDPRESVLLARHSVRLAFLNDSVATLRRAVWDSRLVKDDWVLPAGEIRGASLSPDGNRAVVLVESNAYVLSLDSRTPTHQLSRHSGRLRVSDFSADGSRLLTAGEDGQGVVWRALDWKPEMELKGHTSGIPNGGFSWEGRKVVTAGQDGTARVWDSETGSELVRLAPGGVGTGDGEVRSSAFNRRGNWLAVGLRDGGISIWDWTTRTLLWSGRHAERVPVLDLEFSPDDRYLASAGSDGRVVVWDGTGDAWQPRRALRMASGSGREIEISGIDFSPRGRLLVVASDQHLAQLWEWTSGTPLFSYRHHDDDAGPLPVMSSVFSTDGAKILTAAAKELVRIWETGVRELPATDDWPAERWSTVRWAAFSPRGHHLLVGDGTSEAFVLRYPRGGIEARLSGQGAVVKAGAFAPDGRHVVTAGADQRLGIWSVNGWALSSSVACTNTAESGMAFSPEGSWLAVAQGNAVRLLETTNWTEQRSLVAHTQEVLSTRFSGDGSLLASGGADSKVYVWRTKDWTLVDREGIPHGSQVAAVAFHPKAHLVGTASDEIRLLPIGPGSQDRRGTGRASEDETLFKALAFAPSGECALSSDGDGHLVLWDVATHRRIGEIPTSRQGGNCVALFTPDGAGLLTLGPGGMGLVYDSVVWGTARQLVSEVDTRWGGERPKR